MPSVDASRVKPSGRGEIEYSTANGTSSINTSTSNSTSALGTDAPLLSVSGENIGDGVGVYAGSNGSDQMVMEFKSLHAGPGITLDDDGSTITVSANIQVIGNGSGNTVVIGGPPDGFHLNLGNVASFGDGSWSPGAVPLTNNTTVSEAVDQLNEVLSKLVPQQPPAFPNSQGIAIATVGTLPLLASSVPDHTGGLAPAAGTQVTRVTSGSVNSTNTIAGVGPTNQGHLQFVINGAYAADVALNGTTDAGTYNGLVILNENAYPTNQPGFWTSFDVKVQGATAIDGVNRFQIIHTAAGSTANAVFVYDPMTATSTITSPTLALSSLGTPAYSSGIPHFNTGGSLLVGGQISNLSGETYYGGGDPLTLSGTNSAISAQVYNFAAMNISTPIPRNTTAATNFSSVILNVDGATHAMSQVQGTSRNVNGVGGTTQFGSTTILVKRGAAPSNKIDENSVLVTGLGTLPNINNAVRVNYGGTGNTPTGPETPWDSTALLPHTEAAVVGGVLQYCVTDFTSGFFPQGPNYSSGRNNVQYATFSFSRTAISNFKINIQGSYTGVWIKLPGVSDNGGISPNAVNGWWDATKAYNGAGVPGNASDATAGCASGAVMNGGSGSFAITFGPQSSTNANSNEIIVRIALNSGQAVTSLSFSN